MRIRGKKKGKTMKLYKIKELEWTKVYADLEQLEVSYIFEDQVGYRAWVDGSGNWKYITGNALGVGTAKTLELAKEECQKYHERLLLQSLEEVDVLERDVYANFNSRELAQMLSKEKLALIITGLQNIIDNQQKEVQHDR
jgi:hypothetical protein